MHPHEHFGPGMEEEGPPEGWGGGPRIKVKGGGGWWGGPPWAGHWAGPGHPHAGGPPWARFGPDFMWFFAGPRRGRGWGRARRGDVRSAILALLAERPMHGYEVIGELSERTEGFWRPSPGSIYPALQSLEDDGLVTASTEGPGGKRRYSLTDKGRAAASALGQAPWEDVTAGVTADARALRHSIAQLMPVVAQVFRSGGRHQFERAIEVLDDTRRRLYAILADGEPAEPAGEPPAPPAAG